MKLYTILLNLAKKNPYPVGSIYMSINNTNPSTLFGGTWEQIKDTFLLSAGDTYTAGDTGGEATHTLTVGELPPHQHPVNIYTGSGSNGGGQVSYSSNRGGSQYSAYGDASTQFGLAHNNMPPYLTVYMWKRTA